MDGEERDDDRGRKRREALHEEPPPKDGRAARAVRTRRAVADAARDYDPTALASCPDALAVEGHGLLGAASRRRAVMSPRGTVLRTVTPWIMSGRVKSSAYSAVPSTLPRPSLRGTLFPIQRVSTRGL